MTVDILKVPEKYSNEYESITCNCGTVYRIPYFKCDENGGSFSFICPICSTKIEFSQENENIYKIGRNPSSQK